VPGDTWQRAKVMEWLFWEQYSHEPVIAVRRALRLFRGVAEEDLAPHLLPRGQEALALMENQLGRTSFLTGETFTAADLCLLPYTGLAPEGGYDLTGLPHLRAWIAACAAELKLLPGIFPAGAGSDS
jgi:glutathione S-transferase